MAQFLTVNGQVFPPGAQRFAVSQSTPITLTLTLSDGDVAQGDEYELNLNGGGIVFNHLHRTVPAGVGSVANLAFQSQGGFTKPGAWQIKIAKTAGAGANPMLPIWTLDFQVQQAPATQNAPRNEERTPATQTRVPTLETQEKTPQPTPARDGSWIKKFSLFTILLSCIAAVVMLLLFLIFLKLLELAGISMMTGLSSNPPTQEMTELDL